MTLEEKLRGLAAKGELTHVSIAAKDGKFYANYAPASASGYAQGVDTDPVAALEAALAASPIKPKRVRKPSEEVVSHAAAVINGEIVTAAVNGPEGPAPVGEIVETGLPSDWTTP